MYLFLMSEGDGVELVVVEIQSCQLVPSKLTLSCMIAQP